MKRQILSAAVVSTLAAMAVVAAGPSAAQSGAATVVKTEPGRAAIAEAVRATATVKAIDKANRLVTLEGAEGNQFVVQVGEKVRNLDQVKVGDLVVVEYLEALTLELKRGTGQVRERIERETAARAQPGQAPGAAAGRQVTVIANVIAVNPAKQTVRLRGPQRIVDLKVRDPEQFKLVKVGDQVEATFTEAVAIALEPAPKGAAPAAKK